MDRVSAFDEPLRKLLGGATAKVMAEHLDLHTVGDLLHHYPRRYEERGRLTALGDLPLDEHVTVVAQVADRFQDARRVLNHIADRHLSRVGNPWFAPPGS